jgi:hypothetical protein
MTTANLAEWSTDRLQRRYDELLETIELKHSESRMSEIKRELAHVRFEITSRGVGIGVGQ